MKFKIKKRIYLAIASLLLLVLQDVGLSVVADRYQMYVNLVLVILAGFGVVTEPKKE